MSLEPNLEPSFAARDYDPRDPPHFGEWVRVEGIDLSAAPSPKVAPKTAAAETAATPKSAARQDEAAPAAPPLVRDDLADILTDSSDAWRVAPPVSPNSTTMVPEPLPDGDGVVVGQAHPEQEQGRLLLALLLVLIVLAAWLLHLGFGGPVSPPAPPAPVVQGMNG